MPTSARYLHFPQRQVYFVKFERLLRSIGELSPVIVRSKLRDRDSAMFSRFIDHGLPLVALKEQRRDLVIALIGRKGPLSGEKIGEIAAFQLAIAAIDSVICDLDAEMVAFDRRVPLMANAGAQ